MRATVVRRGDIVKALTPKDRRQIWGTLTHGQIETLRGSSWKRATNNLVGKHHLEGIVALETEDHLIAHLSKPGAGIDVDLLLSLAE
jgi:hypothetical protein